MQSTIKRQPLRGRVNGMVRAWQWLLLLCLTFGAAPAWAECTSPQTATVPSGGSAVFTCATFGFEDIVTPPQNGTAIVNAAGAPGGSVTYANNGNGATSDSFVVDDDNDLPITFLITVQAPTSPITVSPSSLPAPSVGVPYSQTLTSSGGAGSYTYVVTGGGLPPGLTLSSAGVISGTSTGAGNYSFTVGVHDATTPTALTASKGYSFTIAAPVFTPAQPTLPTGAANTPYSLQLGTTGGTAPYTYSAASGLPNGLALSAGGLLSGTPTANGTYTITYTVQDGTTSSSNGNYSGPQSVSLVISSAPTVTAVSPVSGPATGGTSVTITGTNLTGATAVSFGGTAATNITVVSATSLTATAPAHAGGTVDVTVTVGGITSATSAADHFTYVAAPTLTSISPTTGPATGGTTVTITGTNFTGATAVTFGATAATGFTVNSATSITASAPAGTGTVDVRVTTTGGTSATSASDQFTYVAAPTVTNISPTAGPAAGGTTVTITGTNFTSATAVTFGATAATSFTVISATSITASAPAGTGAVDILVTSAGGTSATSASDQFTYVAAPTVTSISPTAGPATGGTTVTIAGTNFTSATAVTFGATAAAGFTINSATSITATAPAGTGTVDIRVTGVGGTSATAAADQFTFLSAPAVSSISPVSGLTAGGTTVTISGTSFAGATAVTFGAAAATSFTVISATQVTATAPAGAAGTVDVRVTTIGGTSPTNVADHFTYVTPTVAGAPTIGTATAGNAQASVTFTAPGSDGGSAITGYIVTSSPGNVIASGTNSPITVTGLTNGTAYTFTVTATNGVGTGGASAASNSITPKGTQTITFSNPGAQTFGTAPTLTASASSGLAVSFSSTTTAVCTITTGGALTFVAAGTCSIQADQTGNGTYLAAPAVAQSFTVNATVAGAPIVGTAIAGDAQATVTFTAPASNGGSTISGYTVTASPGGFVGSGSNSPITVAGLTNGTAYTFTVTANNGIGSGTSSAASNSVTPRGVQAITFSNPGSINFGAPTQLAATASSGLSVAFTSSTTNVCTVTSAGALSTLAPGTCTINADQAGNVAYLPAARATQSFAIVVPGGAVTITTASLAAGTGGTTYSVAITAAGGAAPYTFTESGALPTGLTLSSAGALSGTPTSSGTYSVTVTVTDAAAQTAQKIFQLTVNAPGIALAPSTLPAGQVGAAYTSTISASGGSAPYSYAITSGALPTGLTLSPAGVLSGTPIVAGSFNVTVTATDKFNFQGTQAYTLTVSAPTIALTPATLPAGQAAVAYSQQFSASGGLGSYTYAVSAGALPTGLTLSASGLLSGTPTGAGNFNVTVVAKDSGGFTGSQAYTVAISQPVPAVVNDTTSTAANASVTIAVTANDTGPITSITVAHAPGHGTATISGLNVVYTPTSNFYGADSFTYTATGPGGTSVPATVAVTVTPLAVPVAQALTATVLAGKAVTLHGAQGATGGPFTALNVPTLPAAGTLTISGTDIVYTPAMDASGAVNFEYTLSNAFGVSLPARVTITVNPMPVAPALTAEVLAGSSVQVDLTANAHGGPFTGAAVVSVSPSNAGSATIHTAADGYALTFTAAATFSGTAQLSYTLSNAYATSAPGNISVSVTARPDPSKDAEVLGILNAQVDSARRLAQGQISNFQQRLESLHNGGGAGGFSNGITLTSASQQNRDPMQALLGPGGNAGWGARYRSQPDDSDGTGGGSPATAGTGSLPGGITVWTGGAVNFGKTQPGSSDNGIDFTTSGLSVGADKRISDALALGVGLGYGHDASDIGQNGSRSSTDSYNVALYASYRPYANVYVDSLLGYQWLSFDARRYVTGDGSIATGSRDGTQLFGSIALGYEHRTQDWLLSPYARLDLAHAQLDGYTEQGLAVDTLSYDRQTVKTTTGNLGLRAEWTIKADYGIWLPTLRAEYEHDFQGSSVAAMRYVDLLSGPLYQASLTGQSSNRTLLGAGIQLQTLSGWMLRFEYQNLLESSARDNQSVLLGVEKKFNP